MADFQKLEDERKRGNEFSLLRIMIFMKKGINLDGWD